MAQIALEWRRIYKDTTEAYPDDTEGANNALGFHDKFPLLQDEDAQDIPMTLPRVLPPERRAAGIELRIMSFNIWNGGLSGGQSLEQTAKAILASGADVVGLQGRSKGCGCGFWFKHSAELFFFFFELYFSLLPKICCNRMLDSHSRKWKATIHASRADGTLAWMVLQ
jgi:hypothetical protein